MFRIPVISPVFWTWFCFRQRRM